MSTTFELQIDASDWTESCDDIEPLIDRAFGAVAGLSNSSGTVSLLLTDDEAMQALNKTWRGKDKPTDVLSFPADEVDRPFLGDIALGYETCLYDASQNAIPLHQHLSHLLIHGYLHLLGHDHQTETQAEKMEALEVEALALLGWPDPYLKNAK